MVNFVPREWFKEWFGWTIDGVNNDLAGNGGEDCLSFIPDQQKWIETIAVVLVSIFEIMWAYPRINLPDKMPKPFKYDSLGKRVVLMLMCLIFGIELGFKFATRQLIWILNPCHLVTMMQIYLLVAPSKKFTMFVFRIMMHCLGGATIAFLFPVVNTRLLPFEAATYYIQHLMMLVVPFYLMRCGGVYTPEKLGDFTYVFMAAGMLYFYHWTFLQWLAITAGVNLNNMMCPAVSDPFYGRGYRIAASFHQTAMIMVHGKFYTWISSKMLPKMFQVEKSSDTVNGHSKTH